MNRRRAFLAISVAGAALAGTAAVAAATYSTWSAATSVEAIPGTHPAVNSPSLDGCPAVARDDLTLYFASARPGGLGGLDIYLSRRDRRDDPWGEPINVGASVNSSADELCPSPRRDGHGFLFVSSRPGGCGGWDLYSTRLHAQRGWADPENLGCSINGPADEASPFVVGDELYFSSTRAGGFAPDTPGAVAGDADIYVSSFGAEGQIGAPALAPGLNTAQQDVRPNLRRDGLELFFDSNRPGGVGNFDLWSSTRAAPGEAWAVPHNLGPLVNSTAADMRASLSWDATTLYFGSTRAGGEGSQDLYVITRSKVTGSG